MLHDHIVVSHAYGHAIVGAILKKNYYNHWAASDYNLKVGLRRQPDCKICYRHLKTILMQNS